MRTGLSIDLLHPTELRTKFENDLQAFSIDTGPIMPQDNPVLHTMIAAARQAGAAIMAYYRPGETVATDVREKSADNPLTQADLEADRLLREQLLSDYPNYGWLSEETADNLVRLSKNRVWVVDPIDGTKEFIQGLPQFAVSIALVEAGLPIAACIYNPAAEELFTAMIGAGTQLNGQPVQVTATRQLAGANCLASRSETLRGEWDQFSQELSLTMVGSIAYKLALLAAGRFDLTFTLTPKNEWDFCAGELLVREAGGLVTNKEGQSFVFNQEKPKTRSVLATNGKLHPILLERLQGTELSPDRHAKPG